MLVSIDGVQWRVLGVGAEVDDQVYLHLASTTEFREQRNGRVPLQHADFYPISAVGDRATLLAALAADPGC
ncbi:hypothetical protein J2T57_001421 [Natronocella acetinitrilica]|uniref:Uncharacterized protein n=1 Tax=Natronocella acetinitrilica TaxID=414046 RepID=A0AAE3G2B4_9GAMM|nr:hypothetical protein [Natronocella acetinitrilica]MCP1674319.1 hypothetical protein [Natronocella acetinitrilica]